MLLAFVDESDRGDFRCFAAVVASDSTTKALTDSLNAIVRQASIDYGVSRTAEIHGHPLFHGKDDWKDVGPRARAGIHEKVVDAILATDATILLRSVSEARLHQRQMQSNYRVRFPAEQVCFQHILQRINRLAERAGAYALVIADERGDRERHRERFATYQTDGTPGVYMHTTLDRLLDTVHFAPSHRSRMLQAADILAFTYRRHETVTETDERAQRIMDRMWAKIATSGQLFEAGQWP